jgi:hypothetical protein
MGLKQTARSVLRPYRVRSRAPWSRLLGQDRPRWARARAEAQGGPRVLIATSTGGHWPSVTLESLLAVALTLRGARVHILLCDRFLPACLMAEHTNVSGVWAFAQHGPQPELCGDCAGVGAMMYAPLGLPVHRFSELVSADEARHAAELTAAATPLGIPEFRLEGLAIGEHAMAGALRFLGRAALDGSREQERVLRRYFEAALLSAYAVRRLTEREQFAAACFHHGIYVPQGVIGEVARSRAIRVVNWNVAYRQRRFVFSHRDTYHHTLLAEPPGLWEELSWTEAMEKELLSYLGSRGQGTRDWVRFHDHDIADLDAIRAAVGIDLRKPTIAMLTNVMWDAQLHYRANAFPSMLEWVLQTIRYFGGRPDLQLVIRVHPAERTGYVPSRQPIAAEIARAVQPLPPNVVVIPPESGVSTYAVARRCNAVLIYGTKTGVELACHGIPIIVAGEAWIRGKGITLDASTAEEYFALLDRLPLPAPLDDATIDRARRYAYHFFFRRMVPIRSVVPAGGPRSYVVRVRGLDDLVPGADPGLDVICDGILTGSEFIYPEERLVGPT